MLLKEDEYQIARGAHLYSSHSLQRSCRSRVSGTWSVHTLEGPSSHVCEDLLRTRP
jgi:hypothetical protein